MARGVVITGAAGGLGQGLTTGFLADGWHVAGIWHKRKSNVAHENFWALKADLTNALEISETVQSVQARWGQIGALINNAGVSRDNLLARMSAGDWQEVLDVNLKGAFLCAKAVLTAMPLGGHIINIGSYSGRAGAAGQANYSAAKSGLIGFTQSLAAEVGSRNIAVNAVLPGVLPTGMTGALTQKAMEDFAHANALSRINSIEEVARFVVFLTSLRNVSGQIFQLDSRVSRWI